MFVGRWSWADLKHEWSALPTHGHPPSSGKVASCLCHAHGPLSHPVALLQSPHGRPVEIRRLELTRRRLWPAMRQSVNKKMQHFHDRSGFTAATNTEINH